MRTIISLRKAFLALWSSSSSSRSHDCLTSSLRPKFRAKCDASSWLKPQKFQGEPQVTKTVYWNINGVTVHRFPAECTSNKRYNTLHSFWNQSFREIRCGLLFKTPLLSPNIHQPQASLLTILKIMYTAAQAITYLLTYSMMQSPSWEANSFADSQEIPRISRNLKVHYRTHKRPPPVSILGQPNPVHIPLSHLLEIHPNIIHPSTPRSPQWSLSLRFPHQDPTHTPLLTHTRHMPSPSHYKMLYIYTMQIL